MTIGELLEQIKDLDPEMLVYIPDTSGNCACSSGDYMAASSAEVEAEYVKKYGAYTGSVIKVLKLKDY